MPGIVGMSGGSVANIEENEKRIGGEGARLGKVTANDHLH